MAQLLFNKSKKYDDKILGGVIGSEIKNAPQALR
jgi:hypothetical protein